MYGVVKKLAIINGAVNDKSLRRPGLKNKRIEVLDVCEEWKRIGAAKKWIGRGISETLKA